MLMLSPWFKEVNQDNGYIVYDIPADNKLIKEIAAAFKNKGI